MMITEKAIQEYQCNGCVNGDFPNCYQKSVYGKGCSKHIVGTTIYPIVGPIFLGLPKGFNRLGMYFDSMTVTIFESLEDNYFESLEGNYDKFNIPVWKHLDKYGNTIIRGLTPRLNRPWIHIFLGDIMCKINCIEITQMDLDQMD